MVLRYYAGFDIAKDQSLRRLHDHRSDVVTGYNVVTMASSPCQQAYYIAGSTSEMLSIA